MRLRATCSIAWAREIGRGDFAAILHENLKQEPPADAKLTQIGQPGQQQGTPGGASAEEPLQERKPPQRVDVPCVEKAPHGTRPRPSEPPPPQLRLRHGYAPAHPAMQAICRVVEAQFTIELGHALLRGGACRSLCRAALAFRSRLLRSNSRRPSCDRRRRSLPGAIPDLPGASGPGRHTWNSVGRKLMQHQAQRDGGAGRQHTFVIPRKRRWSPGSVLQGGRRRCGRCQRAPPLATHRVSKDCVRQPMKPIAPRKPG